MKESPETRTIKSRTLLGKRARDQGPDLSQEVDIEQLNRSERDGNNKDLMNEAALNTKIKKDIAKVIDICFATELLEEKATNAQYENLDEIYEDFGWMKKHWRTIYLASELKQIFVRYNPKVQLDLFKEFVLLALLEEIKRYDIDEIEDFPLFFTELDRIFRSRARPSSRDPDELKKNNSSKRSKK